MQKRYKYILFTFVAVTLFLYFASPILALEINYPNIPRPGRPDNPYTVGVYTSLLGYIEYFFMFLVVSAGIAGIVSIVISGLNILLHPSNPSALTDAKDRMFGSTMGIVLLMFSFILLRTINPQLVVQSEAQGDRKQGVYYMSDAAFFYNNEDVAPKLEANVYDAITRHEGYQETYLFYNCTTRPADQGRTLLVWIYDQTDFRISRAINGRTGIGLVITIKIPCSASDVREIATGINPDGTLVPNTANAIYLTNVKSFKWEYQEPGVYFYLTNDCSGISTKAQKNNGAIEKFDNLTGADAQLARSFKIINGTGDNEKYGAVLSASNNAVSGEVGECTAPVTGDVCYHIFPIPHPNLYVDQGYEAKSAYILNVAPRRGDMPPITLQSETRRKTISASQFTTSNNLYSYPNAGHSNLTDLFTLPINGSVSFSSGDATDCKEVPSCLKKVIFPRNAYHIILYSKNYTTDNNTNTRDRRCYMYKRTITNLQGQKGLQEGRDFYQMYIVPSSK